MSFWVKLLEFLETKGETPTMYGAFHIVFIVLVALATFLLCKFFGSSSERTYRRIVLIGWIAMVVLEVYKQIIYAVSFENGAFVWDYEWYAFPYQLCSTPLYVMPFAALLKNGRVRDAAMAYLATFSFFGGLVVFIYPGDVFVSTIGISAQSMIHHGMQIVIGIYTAFYNRKRFNFGFFLHAVPAFAALCAAALIMNIGVYHAFAASGKACITPLPHRELKIPSICSISAPISPARYPCSATLSGLTCPMPPSLLSISSASVSRPTFCT